MTHGLQAADHRHSSEIPSLWLAYPLDNHSCACDATGYPANIRGATMPLDSETIAQQLDLLAAHRRRLASYLRQQAELGMLTPPGAVNDIEAARTEIRRIKEALRKDEVSVEEGPNDEAPPQVEQVPPHQIGGPQITIDTAGGD